MNVLGAVAKGLGDVVLGSGPEDEVTEAVEALLERIATGFIPEDRAMATTKLKELVTESPASREAFGQMGFPVVREVIVEDGNDVEAIRGVLELLNLSVRVEPKALEELASWRGEGEGEEGSKVEAAKNAARELDRASIVVAELFCREGKNLDMLFGLLATNQPISDFYTRYNALKCLNSLLLIHSHAIQQHVLGSPTAVAKLMDLLGSDEIMEVERNESLLLLVGLCKATMEIQKLVVFEGAFDHIFAIIGKEQKSGVIAQDCLELLIHLLTQNSSNQLLFRESGHLQKLLGLLPASSGSGADGDESVDPKVVFLALEVLNVLLRPPSCSSKNDRKMTQDMLECFNLMDTLVDLTCKQRGQEKGDEASETGGVTYAVLGQAFRTLSCLLLQNSIAKDSISGMTVRWTVNHTYEDVPVLLAILLRCLGSKSKFERDAALETISSFCEENETGQAVLASTVHSMEDSELLAGDGSLGTFGTNLLKAISAGDGVSRRQAALVMAILLDGSTLAKDRVDMGVLSKFVRVISSEGEGGKDGPLCQAVLKLLCVWLRDSTSSVEKFFSSPSNIPLVVDLIAKGDGGSAMTKGLASIVLGMCVLAKVETKSTSMFYTSSSVLDIVSKHVGLHKFFCTWEDMTSSTEFKKGLHPLRTSKVITKKEVDACFSLVSSPAPQPLLEIIQEFFGFHAIFSSSFSAEVKELQPLVRQGIVNSYSGPDLNQAPSGPDAKSGDNNVDPEVVRKLQDEIKQLRSRNESLATDLLAMSQTVTSSSSQDAEGTGESQKKEQVDKDELIASKAKQAELDIALRESDKKVEDLERQLRLSAEKLKEEEAKTLSIQEESGKHENDLKDLADAYNNLEEHSFSLESKLQEMEKQLKDKDESAQTSEAVKEVEAKYEAQLQAMKADLDRSNEACTEMSELRDASEAANEQLKLQATDLKNRLEEERSNARASSAAAVSNSELEEMKAKTRQDAQLEMEEALRTKDQEHDLEMESLKEQLQTSQAQYKEIFEAYESNSSKAYTEEELNQATENARNEAAADCDEEIYQLETKLRDMQSKLSAASAAASQEQTSQEDLEAAIEKAKEDAMAEADESMNDLLVCLGQEEKKTEILRERLEALGENVDELLEGLEDDEEEDDEDDEDQ
ncbi:Golgin candidate 6 [Chloropicon primus]|uniref:Uncharacterized protein n=1 Tax=Chloropicon primus TaxID=1764295 RepID=A0A5B8MVS0_9CHLO|nr:hypothetical protein A3770_14p71570 [Chloropicon primus]UPR03847.1 Golgin candidate 6 [Chloropicon primus]|eukprot:QDZ24639.1 hypothetical protein A3770_14p71570 [Chloropicon primus]